MKESRAASSTLNSEAEHDGNSYLPASGLRDTLVSISLKIWTPIELCAQPRRLLSRSGLRCFDF